MKTKLFIKSAIVAILLFASCNNRNDNAMIAAAEEKAKADIVDMTEASDEATPPPPSSGFSMAGTLDAAVNKSITASNGKNVEQKENNAMPIAEKIPEKIKKTADINLTVTDYEKARAAIGIIVKSGKGYIGSENEQHSTYTTSNSMVIRVANKDFDNMVSNIASLEGHVNSKNIYIEDVTAEFVDITARLKSKKEVEQRYRDLLQKAVKVSDVLEVEEQLRVIREEIEAKEGELKYLNDRVAFSTINLSFHQDFEFTPTENPGFFGRIGAAFGNGWNGFLAFIIGLVYAWPLWLILATGGWLLYRFIKKRVKK